jgi:TPR repeat protein
LSRRERGTALLAVFSSALFLCITGVTSPARADAAAGREAYEKGDYAQAMSEWQIAAEAGDAEAELGLGSLYEIGAGGSPRSYKRAEYWYQKAARKGNIEAAYRLSLILMAGSDDFPRDLVNAYNGRSWRPTARACGAAWQSI